jgi:hypothetical protein
MRATPVQLPHYPVLISPPGTSMSSPHLSHSACKTYTAIFVAMHISNIMVVYNIRFSLRVLGSTWKKLLSSGEHPSTRLQTMFSTRNTDIMFAMPMATLAETQIEEETDTLHLAVRKSSQNIRPDQENRMVVPTGISAWIT